MDTRAILDIGVGARIARMMVSAIKAFQPVSSSF